MKTTAQILGLMFVALALTARAEDKPAATTEAPPPPAETPKVDMPADASAKAEAVALPSPALNFTPLAHPKPEDTAADPNVLELPKMTVKQKPRPRLTPEIMVTRQAFGEELAKKKFSALDQALNKYTLPLFGSSMAERALADYEREKKAELISDTENMAKALEKIDPAEAKALKEAAAKP